MEVTPDQPSITMAECGVIPHVMVGIQRQTQHFETKKTRWVGGWSNGECKGKTEEIRGSNGRGHPRRMWG